jgi:hypothetical protein
LLWGVPKAPLWKRRKKEKHRDNKKTPGQEPARQGNDSARQGKARQGKINKTKTDKTTPDTSRLRQGKTGTAAEGQA